MASKLRLPSTWISRPRIAIALLISLLLVSVVSSVLAQTSDWPESRYDGQPAQSAIDKLDSILAGDEFQWPPEPAAGPIERFVDWLVRLMINAFPAVGSSAGRTLSGILTVAGVGFLLAVLVYVGRRLYRGMGKEPHLVHDQANAPTISSASAAQQANLLSGSGDYRQAVRMLYLSALLSLDEQTILSYDRSRTNREHVQAVSDRPDLARQLKGVVDVFDAVWYGYHPLDNAEYVRYEQHIKRLRQET